MSSDLTSLDTERREEGEKEQEKRLTNVTHSSTDDPFLMRLTFEPHECTSFIEKKGKSTVLKQYKWQFFQVFTLHPFSSCFHFSLPSQGSITGKYISGHGKYKHTMCHIRPAAGDFATDELTK